ncbi:hypothetical protein [Spirosoma linguale]|uniref:Uncharacterized protein n=1 Tax=Spirosoma linguale (strain ATCC 33905 / DSM 74 / LMG 10896 / Claus 1) TaxID=504472 RepID=D2QV72_SPILD|nr:hypothetical protein Slin_6748 [Spirosoma linguale DSM 74]
MHQTIRLIQLVFGVAFTLGLLGWCLYRLAIWFRLILVWKQTKPARRPTNDNQTRQAGKPSSTKGPKKGPANLSRQMLYTARRKRD